MTMQDARTPSAEATPRELGWHKGYLSGSRPDLRVPVRRVHLTNDQDVTLRRLRITGGSASTGGGINHAGRLLTMTACTVHDNAASGNTFSSYGGGIYNQSGHTANLTACTISDNDCTGDANGGGISNWGTMTLTNCLVSANTTSASSFGGGGIINVASGDLTLDNTEVRQNHASQGGGLINTIGTMRVTNGSSITLNTAANVPVGRGAGIFSFGDGTFIDDSSITENTVTDSTEPIFFSEGGGIYNSGGTVHLANGASIANNVAQFQPNCGGSSNSYEGEGCAP